MNGVLSKNALPRSGMHPGWLMVAVGSVLLLLMFGTRLSFGLYIKPIAESFGASRASVSASQSLYMVVYSVFALIAGGLTDRYGPRKVLVVGAVLMGLGMLLASRIATIWQYYLSYGILVAIGSGAMYVPVTGAVSKLFDRRRNLALGITASGAGLGQFLFPPLMEGIVEARGWQAAFVCTAFLLLVIGVGLPWFLLKGNRLPLAQLAKENRKEIPSQQGASESLQAQTHYTLFQAMKTAPFWMYFGMYFIVCFVIDGVLFVHLYPYFTDIGFEGQTAAKAFGLVGLISTVTMIAFAPVGDKGNKRHLLILLFAIHTLLLYWLMKLNTALGLWAFVAVYGVTLGAAWPLTLSILPDIFGSRSVSSILGVCTLAFGLAGLLAPWLAGYLFDLYGSYLPVFRLTILLSIGGVVFTFFIRKTKGMK
jgi:MFS family permease